MAEKQVKEVYVEEPSEEKGFIAVKTTANLKDEDGNLKESRRSALNVFFGESIDEFIEKYGKEATFSMVVNGGKVDVQNKFRYVMENDENPEAALKAIRDNWVPGAKIDREKDVVGKALRQHAAMNPDDQLRIVIATMRQTKLPDGSSMDDKTIAAALKITPAKVKELSK